MKKLWQIWKNLKITFFSCYLEVSGSFFFQTQPMADFLSPAERTKIRAEMDKDFKVVRLPNTNLRGSSWNNRGFISIYCNCNPIKIMFRSLHSFPEPYSQTTQRNLSFWSDMFTVTVFTLKVIMGPSIKF